MPKVSIIFSSYNHAKFISKAIDSILAQSFQDFEVIIFDDCSTDNSFEIAEKYKGAKIKLYKAPYNRGMAINVNEAISLAGGEYIANMNSDDYWHPDKLLKQVEFLDNNPKYAAVFTDVNLVNERDKIIKTSNFKYFENVANRTRQEWLQHWFYHGNCICYPSAMIRRSCYDKVGLYNPAFVVLLDFDMWIRICLAGYEIFIIKEPLTYFRLLNNFRNLGRQKNISLSMLEHDYVIRNYLNIASKDDFSKIFPQYDKAKLENNLMQYCLADLVNEQYLQYLRKVRKSKAEAKFFKKLENLKKAFVMRFLFSQIYKKPEDLKMLKENFGLDFKEYLELVRNRKDFSPFYQNVMRSFLRIYIALTTLSSIILLYLFITQ